MLGGKSVRGLTPDFAEQSLRFVDRLLPIVNEAVRWIGFQTRQHCFHHPPDLLAGHLWREVLETRKLHA